MVRRILLAAVVALCGGCDSFRSLHLFGGYTVVLRVNDTSRPVNNGSSLIVDVVRAEGNDVAKIKAITPYVWHLDKRDHYKAMTTTWRIEWVDERTHILRGGKLNEELESKCKMSSNEARCTYKLPKGKGVFSKEEPAPFKVFIFADYEGMVAKDPSDGVNRLDVDPREKKMIEIIVGQQRLGLAAGTEGG